jgi:uncharacterized protein DUF3105
LPDAPRDPNRRLTNAERREEARRKREEIQRQMSRKRRTRLVGGVALVLAAALIAALVVLQPFAGEDAEAQAVDLLKRAPAAATAAGCADVETIGPYGGISDPQDPKYVDQTHIGGSDAVPTPPKLSTYPSVPPASGPHAPIPPGPAPAGVYEEPPDIYRAIHSLEHGATIVWYTPTATGPALDELKAFYARRVSSASVGQDRVLIAPYDYPEQGEAGRLPPGVQMALVSWHRLQTCSSVSLPVAFAFTSKYSYPTSAGQTYAGEAPEAGAAL